MTSNPTNPSPRPPQRANPFGHKIPWVMLSQQAAQAIAIAAELPLYVRLHWLAMGRVDHAGHVHLMPAEAAELLDASSSEISKAIAAFVRRRLLCEGSIPTCLRVPADHVVRRDSSRTAQAWQCPRPPSDSLRQAGPLLLPGLLALRPDPQTPRPLAPRALLVVRRPVGISAS